MSENGEQLPLARVSLVGCQSYDEPRVSEAVAQALELLGDIARFVKPGHKVLLKPNLLSARLPEEGVTTHPAIVKAVIQAVKQQGGTPLVGDGPGGPVAQSVFDQVVERSGIKQVCLETGAWLVNLGASAAEIKSEQGKLYKRFRLSRWLKEVDVVINLPKLKTHQFMTLTAGVKNLFGLIPGLQKGEFHLKVPERQDFADMLIDLYLAVRPQLTVVDGVVAMEGAGPSAGTLRTLGLILAGDDALAVDLIASQVLGFDLDEVPTNRAALKRGLASQDLSHIETSGLTVTEIKVNDFARPAGAIQDKAPAWLVKKAKNLVSPKPVVKRAVCTGCRICANNCPVQAIAFWKDYPEFDYDLCIRCYCCQELCPDLAIELKTNRLGQFLASR